MKSILISAGHSMTDPGACANGLREADLTLQLRDKIYDYLHIRDLTVFRDGVQANNQPLNDAIRIARQVDIAVELHFNAGPPNASGIEALCNPSKKETAQALCRTVAGILNIPLRGQVGWKDPSSGQHHRLGFCNAGGIILEVCFITSVKDVGWYEPRVSRLASALGSILQTLAAKP